MLYKIALVLDGKDRSKEIYADPCKLVKKVDLTEGHPVRQFFMRVKHLVTCLVTAKPSLRSVSMLALVALFAVAWEPKHEQTDQVQIKVTEGNASLERMEEIDRTLRAGGIIIKHPALSSHVLNRKTHEELQDLRKSVFEYAQHAESVMKIASRPDVRFSDKERISESLAGANRLLSLIDAELGQVTPPKKERLTSELWANWRTCQKWSRENPGLYGIRMRPDLMETSTRAPGPDILDTGSLKPVLARMGRQRRLRINKMAQRHAECLKLEIQMEHVFNRQDQPRSLELLNLKANIEKLVTETAPPSEP